MASESGGGTRDAKDNMIGMLPYHSQIYMSSRGILATGFFWERGSEFELRLERAHGDGSRTWVDGGLWPSMGAAHAAAESLTEAMTRPNKSQDLRGRLVQISLDWESHFGVAPSVTSAISELDAALLIGMKEGTFCADGKARTAVSKDVDFICDGLRYQVTANRPSGKKGSVVTLVSQKTEKKRPFGWDRLIWILYDRLYAIQEAWEFTAEEYRRAFGEINRLSPAHMRQGRKLFPNRQ